MYNIYKYYIKSRVFTAKQELFLISALEIKICVLEFI